MRLQQEVVVELLESTTGDELRMTGFLCLVPFVWELVGPCWEGVWRGPGLFFFGGNFLGLLFFLAGGPGGGGVGTCMWIPSIPGPLSCIAAKRAPVEMGGNNLFMGGCGQMYGFRVKQWILWGCRVYRL